MFSIEDLADEYERELERAGHRRARRSAWDDLRLSVTRSRPRSATRARAFHARPTRRADARAGPDDGEAHEPGEQNSFPREARP